MRLLCALVLSLVVASPAMAQHAAMKLESSQDTAVNRPQWSPLRVAKWSSLLASTGAAVYGFAQNRVADREYEDIERFCQNDPAACATRPGSSEYADPALEARYQSVVQRDDRARIALLAGQVGLAASVLMFILDLPESTTPDDIPYDPRPLRLTNGSRGLEVGLHFEVR
jgi:hypothetical protein